MKNSRTFFLENKKVTVAQVVNGVTLQAVTTLTVKPPKEVPPPSLGDDEPATPVDPDPGLTPPDKDDEQPGDNQPGENQPVTDVTPPAMDNKPSEAPATSTPTKQPSSAPGDSDTQPGMASYKIPATDRHPTKAKKNVQALSQTVADSAVLLMMVWPLVGAGALLMVMRRRNVED